MPYSVIPQRFRRAVVRQEMHRCISHWALLHLECGHLARRYVRTGEVRESARCWVCWSQDGFPDARFEPPPENPPA